MSTTEKILLTLAIAATLACIGVVSGVVSVSRQPITSLGSVERSSEYHSTTTSSGHFGTSVSLVSGQSGTLGSVVITGAAAGALNIYDATTSSAEKNSNLLVSLPASAAAGTYTFDVVYFNGLIIESTGTMPTSTITYR